MTPEELLRQTSVTNRAAHQQKQTKQQKIRSRQNPHAVALSYDAASGSQQIQLSDGSIREAQTNSNGVIGVGDTVALHQGKGRSRINVMPHKPTQRQAEVSQSAPSGSVKVLFSVVVDGVRRFYVGGDRQTPTKIFEIPATDFFQAYITNTGKKINDWIASFDRSGNKAIVTPSGQWIYNTPQSGYVIYRGGGFWSSDLVVASMSTGAAIQSGGTSVGELTCGGTTYALFRSTITGRITGPVTPSFLSASSTTSGTVVGGNDGGSPPIGITTSLSITDSRSYEAVAFGLYKSEFNTLAGSRNFTAQETAARGCDTGSSSYTQEEITAGSTYLAPDISRVYESSRYFLSQSSSSDVYEDSDSYYLPVLTGVNSRSAIAIKISQTRDGSRPDAGLKLFTKTANDLTETAIAGTLPTLNLATQNLIGSRIYQVPILEVYKTQKIDVELDVFAIAETVSNSKKKAPVLSLKSQNCTIHSASAFL
uniref:hypothetical protein n=1 Tax=Trichocoleus desertorum TaxID=1481672 RepID=UPI0025B40068|nr:hypothetical protein [Trichocoleus desertorum]